MSVIIKTMNIPKTCEECKLESFCDLWVDARRMCGETFTDSKSRIKATIRHPDCPLGEIPLHGRLIDADALKINLMDRGIEDIQTDDFYEIQQIIDDAPTIIEAEDSFFDSLKRGLE